MNKCLVHNEQTYTIHTGNRMPCFERTIYDLSACPEHVSSHYIRLRFILGVRRNGGFAYPVASVCSMKKKNGKMGKKLLLSFVGIDAPLSICVFPLHSNNGTVAVENGPFLTLNWIKICNR